jgi:hypothetical protein
VDNLWESWRGFQGCWNAYPPIQRDIGPVFVSNEVALNIFYGRIIGKTFDKIGAGFYIMYRETLQNCLSLLLTKAINIIKVGQVAAWLTNLIG